MTVPSVLGMNQKEATKALYGFNIEYSGAGDKVILQNPEGNTKIKEGGTVKILLN